MQLINEKFLYLLLILVWPFIRHVIPFLWGHWWRLVGTFTLKHVEYWRVSENVKLSLFGRHPNYKRLDDLVSDVHDLKWELKALKKELSNN